MPTLIRPRLKTKRQSPYGGLFVVDAREKGMVGSGGTFEMLLDRVRDYRHANAIPTGLGFEDELEEEVCGRYPDACLETDPRVPPREGSLTGEDVIHGTEICISRWSKNTPPPSQEEANRRALICANCAWQRTLQVGCGGRCGQFLSWLAEQAVAGLIHPGKTPYDDRLHSCGVCHCYNSIAVWVPLEMQWSVLSEKQKSQFKLAAETQGCWKVVL